MSTQPTNDIYDIRDWSPEKTDTLEKSTHDEMITFWKKYEKDIPKLTKPNLRYAFKTGPIRVYNPTSWSYQAKPPGLFEANHVCFGLYNTNWDKKYTDGLLWMATKQARPRMQNMFFRHVFDPELSPWKDALPYITVIKNKKTKYIEGAMWTNVDGVYHKLVSSLMIALKFGTCFAEDFMWCQLVKAGIHPSAAIAILGMLHWRFGQGSQATTTNDYFSANPLKKNVFISGGLQSGSKPFGTMEGFWHHFSPAKFIHGKYNKNEKLLLRQGCQPQPCNTIWNTSKTIWTNYLPVYPSNNSPSHQVKDSWGICDLIMGKKDPGLVKELNDRFLNDIPIDWSKKN